MRKEVVVGKIETARLIRLYTVREYLRHELIAKDEALKILSMCLTPDDESTRYDDRKYLEMEWEEVLKEFEMGERKED
jgi:hypothetical protein